ELSGYIAKLDETIRQAEENQYDFTRADRYQEIADSLMAIAYEHGKGLAEVELTISGETEKIELDPSTTVFANAEKFYGKARHSRNAKKELVSKIESFKKKLAVARSIYDRINIAANEPAIEELAKEASRQGLLAQSEAKQASAEATYREYIVHGGYTVLVGKNAKQNDELTMHVAGKEDMWLHARHVPGSHVIIRSRSKTDVMPKETIIAAAEIAAYYSDAKSQKVAPVAYTKRKYVRKPRKALPGQVLIEKEEVVLVEPKLPAIQTEDV
ncbi:MAG TPA: NFACT RNA binding domain-containing protein, partial [Candidatus Kapabacteria bacterium]